MLLKVCFMGRQDKFLPLWDNKVNLEYSCTTAVVQHCTVLLYNCSPAVGLVVTLSGGGRQDSRSMVLWAS